MPLVGSIVSVTGENFGMMVRGGSVLVDKSLGIKEFWEGESFSLITRPRRFGKSLTLSMFQHFFAEQIGGYPTGNLFVSFFIWSGDI